MENVIVTLFIVFVILLMIAFLFNSFASSVSPAKENDMDDNLYLQTLMFLNVEHRKEQPKHRKKHCDKALDFAPQENVCPSGFPVEHPMAVHYHSGCQLHPKPNPELAVKGTGIGEPAYEDVNEFPAPYHKSHSYCQRNTNKNFNVLASDGFSDEFSLIDYKVSPPKFSGLACKRPSGVGKPAFEKNNEFPAPYDDISH